MTVGSTSGTRLWLLPLIPCSRTKNHVASILRGSARTRPRIASSNTSIGLQGRLPSARGSTAKGARRAMSVPSITLRLGSQRLISCWPTEQSPSPQVRGRAKIRAKERAKIEQRRVLQIGAKEAEEASDKSAGAPLRLMQVLPFRRGLPRSRGCPAPPALRQARRPGPWSPEFRIAVRPQT